MNKYEFMGHTIWIAGFIVVINDSTKTIGLIQNISSECNRNCTIQLLNARGIAGKKHLLQATSQALIAFDRGENISNDLGLEICVRASFQRQISRALKILGIKEGEIPLCVVAVDCDNHVIKKIGQFFGEEEDKVFQADVNAIKNLYQITDNEINAAGNIERVVMERTALLCIEI